MKNLLLTFFIVCFLQITTLSQNGWFATTPKPQGNYLSSVCFADENTIWAVGNNGAIIKSTDAGSNWETKNLSSKNNLLKIQFINESFGVICARERDYEPNVLIVEHGIVLITTDAGQSWQQKFKVSDLLTDVFFVDQLNGWAVADSGKVFTTADGGNNWTEYYCSEDVWLQKIYFADLLNGWTISYGSSGGVFKTTDGGVSWLNVGPTFQGSFTCMNFISSNIGWIGGSEIFKTTDAGVTWQQLTSSGGMEWFNDIYFVDEFTGWLISFALFPSNSIMISKTTDGGISWTIQEEDVYATALQFINSDKGCAVGHWGTIMKSSDGGQYWSLITEWLPISFHKADFPTLDVGFALARSGSGTSATYYVLKTTDSGNNWTFSDSVSNTWLIDLEFKDEFSGWITGFDFQNNNGIILGTSDGGYNWVNQYSYSGYGITSIHFINSSIGWAGIADGNNGELLSTTNGGTDWNLISTGYSFNPYNIFFIDHNIGWVIGHGNNSAKIIKTTDGGLTWFDASPQNLYDVLYDIDFVNEQLGWVVGEHGICIKTTDSGLTWTQTWPQPWPQGPAFHSVEFANENIGWIITDDNLFYTNSTTSTSIFYTTNGGNSWELQSVLSGHKGSLNFFAQNTGWFVGGNNVSGEPQIGFVYKTTTGGIAFVESKYEIEIVPKSNLLLQNYPNPFNPSTKISWQLPTGSHQTLKIYDVLGNEVATLVDEYKPAGSYKVEWDASGLPSGVYFYRLQAGEFIETKKMILMK